MLIKRCLRGLPLAAFISCTVLFPSFLRAQSEPAKTEDDIYNWVPWIETGGYLGNVRGRGELALWAPILQTEDSLVFTDIRFKAFESDAREGNFAIGYRKMLDGFNFGVWGGFDTRHSQLGRRFHQLAGGLELLSYDFDFRTNAYLPLNTSELVSSSTSVTSSTVTDASVELDDGFVSIFNTALTDTQSTTYEVREHAMYGVDAEFGVRIPLELAAPQLGLDPTIFDNADVRLYAGGYYFDNQDIEREIIGTKLRLEIRFEDILPQTPGSRLTAEAEYQYDDVRDHQYEFGLRLRLPFNGESRTTSATRAHFAPGEDRVASLKRKSLRRRMSEGLERDTDVVHQKKNSTTHKQTKTTTNSREFALDAETGARLDRFAYVDARSSLADRTRRAGSNSLIVASGTAGSFKNNQVELMPDQTLVGGGSRVDVVGSNSGRHLSFVAPGSRPTLLQTSSAPALVINTNTHVKGIDIVGGGTDAGAKNTGIETAGKHTSGFVVNDVAMTQTGGHAVRIHSNATDYTLNDLEISHVAVGNGIDIETENTGFVITDTTISDIEGRYNDAILLARRNRGVIANTTFGENISDAAIRMTSDNTITGTGNTAVEGQRLCETFETGNIVDVVFNDITGCD